MKLADHIEVKRRLVMAVLDEEWSECFLILVKLSGVSPAELVSILMPPVVDGAQPALQGLVDPATCGHDFVRADGLRNAFCRKCGAELLADHTAYLARATPLFREGNPASQLDAVPKQPTVVAPPPEPKPVCNACQGAGTLKVQDPMEPKGFRMLECPCMKVPLKPKAQTLCPLRGAGHFWTVSDTYTDRCVACKLTRPRPKDKPAPGSSFGDPSDL